jgi:ribose 5-phosphate isomerase B
MQIFIGADHGGFKLKNNLVDWLLDQNIKVIDLGAKKLDNQDDYPDFSLKVAKEVANNPESFGILICRSGGGASIAANKVKNIRAVNVFDKKSTVHAKEDNDANIMTLGANWCDLEQAKELVTVFLETKFSNLERHIRRIGKIEKYESLS